MTGARSARSGTAPDFVPVKSADRVMTVMEALSRRRDRRPTLSDLSAELSIPMSSLHGLLRTMQSRGWVETDETGSLYRIGVRALTIGSSYARGDQVVLAVSPVLDWLAEHTGETVHHGRLVGPDIVYLAKRESRFKVRVHSSVGQRIPAHASSLGKAILAAATDEWVLSVLADPLAALTPNTITDRSMLLVDLAVARERGWAVEREESDLGLGCVAVDIPGPPGTCDAISFAVPLLRLSDDRVTELAELLVEARAMLRAGSGAVPSSPEPGYLNDLDARVATRTTAGDR